MKTPPFSPVLGRDIRNKIGQQLRSHFGQDHLQEPMPPAMADALRRLKEMDDVRSPSAAT